MKTTGRTESGVIAVVVALLSLVLLGVLAVVADFGMAYANQRRLQSGADAAALAVGQRVAVRSAPSDSCSTLQSKYGSDASLRTYAEQVFGRNVSSDAQLSAGSAGLSVACERVGANPQTLVVRTSGAQQSPSFFGGVVGGDDILVSRDARAVVGPQDTVVGLRPFGVCSLVADEVRSNPGATVIVPIDNLDAGCGAASGNWSTLDFNGGANGTPDLKEWIRNGYDGPISVAPPTMIEGDPGLNVSAAFSELDYMMTQSDIVLPVYVSVSGAGGNNAEYRVVGFISATPCRYEIRNKSGPGESAVNPGCDPLPTACDPVATGIGVVGGAQCPRPLGFPDDFVQIKYSAYIPVGSLNLGCSLADTCDTGPRATMLAD